jgi:hypothetical protein
MKGPGDAISDLSRQVEQLALALRSTQQKALSLDQMSAPPRIGLHGQFEHFDPGHQALAVKLPGEPHIHWYPLSYYDGEWLPIPGQQVMITRTRRGAPARAAGPRPRAPEPHIVRGTRSSAAGILGSPRIIGFGERGTAIPPAPVETLQVVAYDYRNRTLQVHRSGQPHCTLRLPPGFERFYDPDIRHGQRVRCRVIDVYPGRYYVPLRFERDEP